MSKNKKIFAFIDSGIDGAMSLLILKWYYGSENVSYTSTYSGGLGEIFPEWCKSNNAEKYDRVFIIDLSIPISLLAVVDHSKFCIVDHHRDHVDGKSQYKAATALLTTSTSCSKILYDVFKTNTSVTLSSPQIYLISLADSCDSYTFTLPEAKDLNIVYNNSTTQSNKVLKFIDDFKGGFLGFNSSQKNIIEFHKNKVKRITSELELYKASFNFNKKTYNIISTFATSCINDISDYVLSRHDVDACVIINTEAYRVSFRRSNKSDINLRDLAKRVSNGDGYEYASVGKLTDTFLTFSKIFKPINEST